MTLNALSSVNLTRVQQSASPSRTPSPTPPFGLKPGARWSLLPLAEQVQEMSFREIKRRLDFMETRYPNNRYSVNAEKWKESRLIPSNQKLGAIPVGVLTAFLFPWPITLVLLTCAAVGLYTGLKERREYQQGMRANYLTMLKQCHLPADFAIPPKAEWKTAAFPINA